MEDASYPAQAEPMPMPLTIAERLKGAEEGAQANMHAINHLQDRVAGLEAYMETLLNQLGLAPGKKVRSL